MYMQIWLGLLLSILTLTGHASCLAQRVQLQVLGSGGPEMGDGRASSAYLIWVADKARVLIDAGGGSSVNFERAGAKLEDLQAVLFTHYHVDHSGDFSAYIKAAYFSPRVTDLPVYGPMGNAWMPSTHAFLAALFGPQGVYPYLSDYVVNFLDPDNPRQHQPDFSLQPYSVPLDITQPKTYAVNAQLKVSAIPVHHGPIAALAWRVDIHGCAISFSGDMNNTTNRLSQLAMASDVLVAHNAIPEGAQGVARQLHMPPSEIGIIAAQANVSKLVLSHRMQRTLGKETQTTTQIQQHYHGPIVFAQDLDRFVLE